MQTSIQYQDHFGLGHWQLVSRSGHVLFEADSADEIRQVRACLAARLAPRPAPIHEERASRPGPRRQAPDWPGSRRMGWPLRVTLALLAIAAVIPFWPAGWRALSSALERAGGGSAWAAPSEKPAAGLPPAPIWPALAERRVASEALNENPRGGEAQNPLGPVWETELREETYTIRRPVVETSYRSEQYTAYEPVTTWRTETVDQGAWVRREAPPVQGPTRLRWTPGGWQTNPRTGVSFWMLPMPRLVREPMPNSESTVRVWQPRMVTVKKPEIAYAPRVRTRKVPVETVRYVTEQAVRRVPVKVCRFVARNKVERSTVPQDVAQLVAVRARAAAGASEWAGRAAQPVSIDSSNDAPRSVEMAPF